MFLNEMSPGQGEEMTSKDVAENRLETFLAEASEDKAFAFAFEIPKELPDAKVYLVGGAVRDLLLGKEAKDFDFIITGVPKAQLESYLGKLGKIAAVESRAFGVFKFVPKDTKLKEPYDVALPRTEHWTGLGYKDVQVTSTHNLPVEEDLRRRDFTINAMAVDMLSGKLVDEFGGLGDLENKIVRAVGEPGERFLEDPSRMLRAIRIACQMRFEIEKETWRTIKDNITEINQVYSEKGQEKTRVASEVMGKEFLRSLQADPVRTVKLLDEAGALPLLLPEVSACKGVPQPPQFHGEGDVFEHTLIGLEKLPKNCSLEVKLAMLFHDIGKPDTITQPVDETDRLRFNEHDRLGAEMTEKIINRLKLFDLDFQEVPFLVKNHMIAVSGSVEKMKWTTLEKYFLKNKKWGDNLLILSQADVSATIPASGKPDFTAYERLEQKIEEVKHKLKFEVTPPKDLLTGNEIMAELNIAEGPQIGQFKAQLREQQLAGKIKDRAAALKALKLIWLQLQTGLDKNTK